MPDLIRDPELDRLVKDLNARGRPDLEVDRLARANEAAPEPSFEPSRHADVEESDPLHSVLSQAVERGASDVLLLVGCAPALRLGGRLVTSEGAGLDEDDVRALFAPHLGERMRRVLEEQGFVDFSLRLRQGADSGSRGAWRFRVNLHRQRGTLAAAVRVLPREIPRLETLHLPRSLADLVKTSRGLVLLCGPTGSGKTSTLAALLGEINRSRACHVVTVEDPVEFEHFNDKGVIEHVEVGRDTPSFGAALKAALRQNPDVVLVGEMRDLETIATALTAAETGHLILSTLHTNDVPQAIHRMVDVFPAAQQQQIRQQLALTLNAIVCQQLLPRADGKGRIPALEVLVATYAIRHHVRMQKVEHLHTEITLGKRLGMVTMEETLARLVRSGLVAADEARMRASHPDELETLLAAEA